MMTFAQAEARKRDIENAATPAPDADPYRLIGELIQWAGRGAATSDEAAEVQRLRLRAQAILQAANVQA